MPRYIYTAKSKPNTIIQGNIEAESEHDAVNKLTKLGHFPLSISVEHVSLHSQGITGFHKFSNKDIVLFTNQLSSLIESGVNLIKALGIIYNQTANKYLKAVLDDVISKIKDGKSFSGGLSAHPQIFSNLYVSMVNTGELSGNLEDVLKRLANFFEKEEEFKNSIRAALTYPFFVFIVSVLTICVLFIFVIPKLVTMFEDMGQFLPLPTRILIGISDLIRNHWWLISAVIFIAVFLLYRIRHNPQGRLLWDRFMLKSALTGQLSLKTETSRLARTLSLLLSSGIPITAALEQSIPAINNQVIRSEVQRFKDEISKGFSLSDSLKNSKFFPAFVISIVTIGEETGSLDKSLKRIADDYEKEVDRALKALTRLLEPAIILVMGLIVGFIVLSMLLPIFQINLIVK